MRGSWNSDENFDYVSDREKFLGMDGGSGLPEVGLTEQQQAVLGKLATRTRSNPGIDPETGAELGSSGGQKPIQH